MAKSEKKKMAIHTLDVSASRNDERAGEGERTEQKNIDRIAADGGRTNPFHQPTTLDCRRADATVMTSSTKEKEKNGKKKSARPIGNDLCVTYGLEN